MHLYLFPTMKRLIFTILAVFLPLAAGAVGYRGIVVPVEFSDSFFSDRHSGVVVKIETARDYLNDQFTYGPTINFDIAPTVRLPRSFSWYGANSSVRRDERIGDLVREACAALQINWSTYDNDADGMIDNVCIIAAGGSEADGAGADHLWPQQGFLSERGGTIQAGGKTVDCFTVCTESSSVAVFCHEFAHSWGLPDLYDTDGAGSGGTTSGLWSILSPMDYGVMSQDRPTPPNFSAIELEMLGIGRPVQIGHGYLKLYPVGSSKEYLRIDSNNEDEYFLLEYRKPEGWDSGIGGEGLIIYHIDKSSNNSWYSDLFMRNLTARERWQHNQVNCRPEHPCARVIEATPGTRDISRIFFPQPGHDSFSSETDPSFHFWSGELSEQAIDNIRISEYGYVEFRLISPIILFSSQVFQDAAIFSGITDNALNITKLEATWHPASDKRPSALKSSDSQVQEDGRFSVVLENLKPTTDYELQITAICEDGKRYSTLRRFTTKTYKSGLRPFMYFNQLERRPDGSFIAGSLFPMRIYNAESALSVDWFFDGEPIKRSPDGYWHLESSGTLRAEIRYTDGSVEIITKKIVVR